jgi:hypothetical protein
MNTGTAGYEDEAVLGPSDRSFGLVFAIVFLIVAVLPLWRDGEPRRWALAAAALCGVLALAWPRALAPANRLWLRIGMAMHRVINPVVMAVLFYLAVTPFGLVMRLFRRGLVRRMRPDRAASSYWIPREGTCGRMDQQF